MKRILVLVVAIGLSLTAAHFRFGDSAHAMGLITGDGGKVRHPIHLPAGKDAYTLILTATVIPPWRGSARVSVEGAPELDASFHPSRPAIDLGLRHAEIRSEADLRQLLDHIEQLVREKLVGDVKIRLV